ncbi:MAG TPA: complex I NDUFA9 subunit family protein [Rhodothermales bacterium]|nr:complex I NDUFA9 subunit family protein [Rhodothermales bacterium]
MNVLVTGGNGFIGSYVLRKLAGTGHSVRVLTRDSSSDDLAIQADNIEVVTGNIREPDSLRGPIDDCDAVIHLVGIIREVPSRGITFESIHAEGSNNVVSAAKTAGVRTFVHMSANGARPDGVSRYQTTKWEAEKAVESAGFDRWTIFRPSIVFGRPDPGRPEFASDLVRQLVRPFPILPVFGQGDFLMQPVAVTSLADAMVQALDGPGANTVFEAGGPTVLPYTKILDVLAATIGSKPKPKINIPLPLVSTGIALLGWTGLLPITSDQLDMLVEGNTCDYKRFHDVFGLEPVPFTVESLSYLD